jgi:WS/DGAT/MGAT family acyltransferase
MVDGISGVELMNIVYDSAPDAAVPAAGATSQAQPRNKTARFADVLRESIISTVESATTLVRGAAELATSWRALGERAAGTARALGAAALHPVARLPFNRTLTGERRLGWLELPFAEMRAIGQCRHGTANDAALAVLADGLGRWLAEIGEPIDGRFLRVLVPVSLRRDDERGQLGNRVSMVPVEIPFDGQPVARLDYVIHRTAAMKRAHIAELVGQFAAAGDVLPAWVAATVLPLAVSRRVLEWTAPLRSAPFLTANMVCTNVPGPPVPLYGLGHRLLAHYPIVPLGFETGLNCALFTYDGVLYVGLLADAAAVPDVGPLTAHLRSAYNDLRTSTHATAPRSATHVTRAHGSTSTPKRRATARLRSATKR